MEEPGLRCRKVLSRVMAAAAGLAALAFAFRGLGPTYADVLGEGSADAVFAVFVSGSWNSVPDISGRELADAGPWVRALRNPSGSGDAGGTHRFVNGVVVFLDGRKRCLGMRPVGVERTLRGVYFLPFFVFGKGRTARKAIAAFRTGTGGRSSSRSTSMSAKVVRFRTNEFRGHEPEKRPTPSLPPLSGSARGEGHRARYSRQC